MTQRIARMDSDELFGNADEVIAAAQERLNALCHGESWRMSVPVQDGDSDVPIGAVIRLAARLRDEREALRSRLAADGEHAEICKVALWIEHGAIDEPRPVCDCDLDRLLARTQSSGQQSPFCEVRPASSAMCARGTKGCEVSHDAGER